MVTSQVTTKASLAWRGAEAAVRSASASAIRESAQLANDPPSTPAGDSVNEAMLTLAQMFPRLDRDRNGVVTDAELSVPPTVSFAQARANAAVVLRAEPSRPFFSVSSFDALTDEPRLSLYG